MSLRWGSSGVTVCFEFACAAVQCATGARADTNETEPAVFPRVIVQHSSRRREFWGSYVVVGRRYCVQAGSDASYIFTFSDSTGNLIEEHTFETGAADADFGLIEIDCDAIGDGLTFEGLRIGNLRLTRDAYPFIGTLNVTEYGDIAAGTFEGTCEGSDGARHTIPYVWRCASCGREVKDQGRWTMDNGLGTMDYGQWTMD